MTPISKSAPHIYLSALPFAPEHSLVAEKFSSRFPNTLTVTEGRPAQWPFTLFTAEHDNHQMKRPLLSYHHFTRFISVTLKQDILFRVHLNLSHLDMVPVSAPMEHIFLLKVMMVQSSGILREVRNSLKLRAQVLSSSAMAVGMTALPQSMKMDLRFWSSCGVLRMVHQSLAHYSRRWGPVSSNSLLMGDFWL